MGWRIVVELRKNVHFVLIPVLLWFIREGIRGEIPRI
jgi:hypothetical protein